MSQTFLRILLAAMIATFGFPDRALPFAADEEPSISLSGGDPVLKLTREQKLAIRGYNQDFQVRKQIDYLPSLAQQYPISNRQLPFAVIGDFNGDGRKDVVLQGYDKTNELLIAVLSSKNGSGVIEISRSKLIDPQTEVYSMGDRNETGLWIYLTFVPRGSVDSPFANKPLELSTDAFQLSYFEKASVLYSWDGQKFQRYVISD